MSLARILAFILGLILLLPGACFLALGGNIQGSGGEGAIAIGVVILIVAGLLFWLAFGKVLRRPPD